MKSKQPEPMDRHQPRRGSLRDYEQRLRDGGQFVTVQRRAILRYLLRHDDHPTTAQIAAAVGRSGAASLATVYNNLALFAKLQLLSAARTPDGEQHWDLRIDPHHHLSCQSCGQVFDIEPAAAEVVVPDAALRRRIDHAEVWLIGRCAPCAQAAS